MAPDSFKGTLSAQDAARALADGLRTARPAHDVVELPIADGGEGTLHLLSTRGAELHPVRIRDALGADTVAFWASFGDTAYVEAAQGAGAHHVSTRDARSCLRATSRGVGMLILDAIETGYRHIVLSTGGTSVTDGGAGMLAALGMKITPGSAAFAGGGSLSSVSAVDITRLDPRLRETRIDVALDVTNPLLGPSGSAAVFAPQKGARQREVHLLEAGLSHWSSLFPGGLKSAACAGSGASGGIGFAALCVLRARPIPGAETLLRLLGFAAELERADLLVVGEGSLDTQSLAGKAPLVAAELARTRGVPVVAVAGRLDLSVAELNGRGVKAAWSLADMAGGIGAAQSEPKRWLVEAGVRISEALPSLLERR